MHIAYRRNQRCITFVFENSEIKNAILLISALKGGEELDIEHWCEQLLKNLSLIQKMGKVAIVSMENAKRHLALSMLQAMIEMSEKQNIDPSPFRTLLATLEAEEALRH